MRLIIDTDKLRAQYKDPEDIRDSAKALYHVTGIWAGIDAAETVKAIPEEWIEAYADWLTQIPAPFAANDERAIRAMLTKWKTNPKLETPEAGCGKDACDL